MGMRAPVTRTMRNYIEDRVRFKYEERLIKVRRERYGKKRTFDARADELKDEWTRQLYELARECGLEFQSEKVVSNPGLGKLITLDTSAFDAKSLENEEADIKREISEIVERIVGELSDAIDSVNPQ